MPGLSLRSIYGLAWRTLRQDRLRTILSTLAVTLGVSMVLATNAIGEALKNGVAGGDPRLGETITGTSSKAMAAVGLVVMAAAGFLIFNGFSMSVARRRQQIGALRALGMTGGQVMRMMLAEALAVGGLGTGIGLITGPLMGGALVLLSKATMGSMMPIGDGAPTISAYLTAVVLGLGVTLLSMLLPARAASRISPLVALREQEASIAVKTTQRYSLIGLLGMAIIAVWVIVAPPGRWVQAPVDGLLAFGLVAIWLLCVTLTLPATIGLFARLSASLLSRFSGTAGRLITDNLQRERRRVTITVLTIAVGLTMIVSLSGITNFLLTDTLLRTASRLTGTGTQLVSGFDFSKGFSFLQDASLTSLKMRPEAIGAIKTVAVGRADVLEFAIALPPELGFLVPSTPSYIVDMAQLRQIRTVFHFTEGSWEQAMPLLQADCAALVSPQVARLNKAQVGSVITITGLNGPIPCTIAGIGTSSFFGISLINRSAAAQLGDYGTSIMVVQPHESEPLTSFLAELATAIRPYSEVTFIAMDSFLDVFKSFIAAGQAVISSILLLAMLAAALGVVNTTASSLTERRRELGLLRAIGASRAQVRSVIAGEALLMGVLGALVGFVGGVGSVLIFIVTYGGNGAGFPDLALWPVALSNTQPALLNGLFAFILAPVVALFAARIPARRVLSGAPIDTLNPPTESEPVSRATLFRRGTIRQRFMIGTAMLLVGTLLVVSTVITTHTSNYLDDMAASGLKVVAPALTNAIELALPPEARNLTIDMLPIGSIKPGNLTANKPLIDQARVFGLDDIMITDSTDTILLSLEPSKIGSQADPLPSGLAGEKLQTTFSNGARGRSISVVMPIHNSAGVRIGSVRSVLNMRYVNPLVAEQRLLIWAIGLIAILIGLLAAWRISAPLGRTTRQLVAQAGGAARGDYTPIPIPRGRFSMRTRLIITLVVLLAGMIGAMDLITLPLARGRADAVSLDSYRNLADWAGRVISTLLKDSQQSIQLPDVQQTISRLQFSDLAKVQSALDISRNAYLAYMTLSTPDGLIVFSDQLSQIGQKTGPVGETAVRKTSWHDEPIWLIAVPLRKGVDGAAFAVFSLGVRTAPLEQFMTDGTYLFQSIGLIAILVGILLAQLIGGVVTAPVNALVQGAESVGHGELNTLFRVDTGSELAVLAQAYNQMVAGLRERERLQELFGRFVSREVAEALRTGQVHLEGETRVVSVLFCDIRGFTSRSEKQSPQAVVALLNEYLPVVVNAAQQFNGTVNKFGGDSTLIIYGAPRLIEESAYQAVLTALAIRAALQRLNVALGERGIEPIRIGLGINTGMALAGAVGPPDRQEYTVIGDTVNLAARIEALNKEYPEHDILISQQTYEALGDRQHEFDYLALGEIAIRGKAQPIQIWSVRSLAAAVSQD